MFEKTLDRIREGVGSAFPCAAVAVGVGHRVFVRQFFGHRQLQPIAFPVTEDTLFDLASVSKVVATTMVALKMLENGTLSLHDRISRWFADTGHFEDCEIIHLMTHTSGLPAGLPLYNMTHEKGEVARSILQANRCYETGTQVLYSCMGYIVLQKILEKVGNAPLDVLAKEYVFTPLEMKNACYHPALAKNSTPLCPVAATERNAKTGEWTVGHVHDENAFFMGGIAGNAGVFATLDDMIAFTSMCATRGIAKNGTVFLSKETFDLAIKNRTPDKAESRGLGFQLKGSQDFPGGTLFSQGSYGHTGFTGTSFYIDAQTGLWGILLTNAVHYGRENRNAYFALRKEFYDTMITEYKTERNGRKQ